MTETRSEICVKNFRFGKYDFTLQKSRQRVLFGRFHTCRRSAVVYLTCPKIQDKQEFISFNILLSLHVIIFIS